MKLILIVALIPIVANAYDRTKVEGTVYGAKAKECFRVIDQDGYPVEGAHVSGAFVLDGWDDYQLAEKNSDTNGEVVLHGKAKDRLHYRVTKNGYYETSGDILYRSAKANPAVVDGKWQPYGTLRTLVLKKIINPIPLNRIGSLRDLPIPTYGEWIGFDFERFAFVSPYGKGVSSDVLMRFALSKPSDAEYHMTMEMSFTNHPCAGAYLMKKDVNSEFASVYEADTNALYCSYFKNSYDRLPGKPPIHKRLSEDEYLVFRTRTKLGADGRLISANYGKICGELNFVGPRGLSFEQLDFNLKPNDPNLEDAETARKSIERRKIEVENAYGSNQCQLY